MNVQNEITTQMIKCSSVFVIGTAPAARAEACGRNITVHLQCTYDIII